MLELVRSRNEKIDAQKSLEASVRKSWKQREIKVVAWRPQSREMEIVHNGEYWFASVRPNPKDRNPRYWNSFGVYQERGNLHIAVEINIATESNGRSVSGFIARDNESAAMYLMHDGGVGGGGEGVGRSAFLAWCNLKPIPIADLDGARLGIAVAQLGRKTIANKLIRYVRHVVEFKEAAKEGRINSGSMRNNRRTFDDYYDEFSGKKKRRRMREIEYISRHGDIVKALRDWRKSGIANERIVKNAYIDLGVEVRGKMTELYEVKTDCERQTIYGAIGQILVHDEAGAGCQRFLVVPEEGEIPEDVKRALKRTNINLVRFELNGESIRIRD